MSKKTLSGREKNLINEAKANLLAAEILEEGLLPEELLEGFFGKLADGFASVTIKPAMAVAGEMKKAIQGGLDTLKGTFAGAKNRWAFAAVSVGYNVRKLPAVMREIDAKSEEGLKTTKACIDEITNEDTKKFFINAIRESASRIAKAQEEEYKTVAKAILDKEPEEDEKDKEEGYQFIPENVQKAYVGTIVQGALLRALLINLK